MEVAFDGEELNPIEFLTMLYGNIQALGKSGHGAAHEFTPFDGEIKTRYDRDKEEIEELMLRFLPVYMEDLFRGEYIVPEYTEQSLRNVFTVGAAKNYFFESMPSMANPLGIGSRALPLAGKVQNLLIADFLNYLALRHNVYLSTMSEEVKKTSIRGSSRQWHYRPFVGTGDRRTELRYSENGVRLSRPRRSPMVDESMVQ